MLTQALWLLVGLAVGAVFVWWFLHRRIGDQKAATGNLERHITERLDRVTEQIDSRLRDNVNAMNESKSFLANRVSSTERTVREVTASLGRLENTTSALHKTTTEITSFQQLLKSPKVRGSFGEVLLINLLGEVLPRDRFATQYTLPTTGEIADAIIKLQDGYIVAVDAKFPLANYEIYMQAQDDDAKRSARIVLRRDIKKHITDISKKYISPADRTLDYAFMYIPVEGVYYETMVHDPAGESLWEFCLKHKVIPISPNSFLAYLQTVLIGLRGLRIQEHTREILQDLRQMRNDFKQFGEDFSMVGKHLTNAKNRFDDSARRLDKFSNRLEQIEGLNHHTLPKQPTKSEASVPAELPVH